jgi:hypothetical protein
MRCHAMFAGSLGAWLVGFLRLRPSMVCFGENVKPGDRDYPQETPNPAQFLLLHGTISRL